MVPAAEGTSEGTAEVTGGAPTMRGGEVEEAAEVLPPALPVNFAFVCKTTPHEPLVQRHLRRLDLQTSVLPGCLYCFCIDMS